MKIKAFLISILFFAVGINCEAGVLTNEVPLGKHLSFSLTTLKDFHPRLAFGADEMIYYRLSNNLFKSWDDTNIVPVKYLVFPSPSVFEFRLYDTNGNEIKKSIKGYYNSQKTIIPKNSDDLKSESIIGSSSRPLFRPDQMFVIKDAGMYELEVRMKICVQLTNGLPDYGNMTTWRDPHVSNTNPHEPATNLAILASDIVRVKVVKE